MNPLIRNPIARARLEGVVLGMCITIMLVWFIAPMIAGDWSLL